MCVGKREREREREIERERERERGLWTSRTCDRKCRNSVADLLCDVLNSRTIESSSPKKNTTGVREREESRRMHACVRVLEVLLRG